MSYEIKARCKHCDRFIPVEAVESSNIRVKCSDRKCKQWNDIKIVMISDMIKAHSGISIPQTKPDTSQQEELNKKLAEAENYIQQLEGIVDGQG